MFFGVFVFFMFFVHFTRKIRSRILNPVICKKQQNEMKKYIFVYMCAQ